MDDRQVKSQEAATVLYNAEVLTMEAAQPRAESIFMRGGVISAVGSNRDLEALRKEPGTRVVDCDGKPVIPGFHDAHIHIMALASSLVGVDCSPSAVGSIRDIVDKITAEAKSAHSGSWIRAFGYDPFHLAEKRHPVRSDLDKAAPAHPVKLAYRSGHACVLNSLALSMAGISRETPDPPGGLIERDLATGEPTGLLFGMDSYLGRSVVPPLAEKEMNEGLRLANQVFLSSGITSLQDATAHNDLAQWEKLQETKAQGILAPAIAMMFSFDALAQFQRLGLGPHTTTRQLRLGMVKMVLDQTRGWLNPPQNELDEQVFSAHSAGFQVALHAVEEDTVRAAVSSIDRALSRLPRADHRHRIEHCSECPPGLLRKIRRIRPVVVTQPAFLYHSGERYLADVAESQIPWLYRLGSLWRNGVNVAASSDGPVVPVDPITGIYAAVARRARTGQVLAPEEALSPAQALWMYTMGGAYACFGEGTSGSLAVGKAADMVILSDDPTRVPVERIKDIQVEKTIIAGRVVWEGS